MLNLLVKNIKNSTSLKFPIITVYLQAPALGIMLPSQQMLINTVLMLTVLQTLTTSCITCLII